MIYESGDRADQIMDEQGRGAVCKCGSEDVVEDEDGEWLECERCGRKWTE